VRYALLDGEGLCGCAGIPSCDLGPGEVYTREDEGYGPSGRVTTLNEVCLLSFG
jgi:hypothetical protein